jgi:hypothetical protein
LDSVLPVRRIGMNERSVGSKVGAIRSDKKGDEVTKCDQMEDVTKCDQMEDVTKCDQMEGYKRLKPKMKRCMREI